VCVWRGGEVEVEVEVEEGRERERERDAIPPPRKGGNFVEEVCI